MCNVSAADTDTDRLYSQAQSGVMHNMMILHMNITLSFPNVPGKRIIEGPACQVIVFWMSYGTRKLFTLRFT
jgi:hypothetical protein